jgi:flagella basal body P-ring formation protein FlgA
LAATAEIRDIVAAFLEQQNEQSAIPPRVDVGALDPRLRLAACDRPLEAFVPQGGKLQGNVTVGVRCSGTKPWSIYVPARVQVYDYVIVAKRPLARGAVLGPDDLDVAERDVAALASGYWSRLEDVLGMTLKQNVRLGAPIGKTQVAPPRMVRRGERVQILAKGAAMDVRMEGEALQDGAKGEAIRVRNLSSRREIEAVISAPGVVEVRL